MRAGVMGFDHNGNKVFELSDTMGGKRIGQLIDTLDTYPHIAAIGVVIKTDAGINKEDTKNMMKVVLAAHRKR